MAEYIKDFRQGETKVIKIDYGAGVDITGWVFYFILKINFTDTENVSSVSATAGDNPADDINNGLAFLTMSSEISAAIPTGKYVYSLYVNKGGTPEVKKILLPPIDEYNDKISIVASAIS